MRSPERLGVLMLGSFLLQVVNMIPVTPETDENMHILMENQSIVIGVLQWLGGILAVGTIAESVSLMWKKRGLCRGVFSAHLIAIMCISYGVAIMKLPWSSFVAYMSLTGLFPLAVTWGLNLLLLWTFWKSMVRGSWSGA